MLKIFFETQKQAFRKNKEHYQTDKCSENVLYLSLNALDSRACPKMSKNYLEVTLSNSKVSFKKKPRRTIKQRKTAKMTYIWFWVHWLAEHAPKYAQYQFTRFVRLTVRDPKEGAKIILKLLFVTRKRVLIKNQRTLSNKEKLRKWLIFDSGCTGWQSTPQNLLNINLLNLVAWL